MSVTTTATPFTFDEQIVSDLYKDAYGSRPRSNWWNAWKAMSHEEKQEEWNHLLQALDYEMELEQRAQAAAAAAWELHLSQIMALSNVSRETAIRWSVDAKDVNGDAGHYCYRWGLPYSHEALVEAALKTH